MCQTACPTVLEVGSGARGTNLLDSDIDAWRNIFATKLGNAVACERLISFDSLHIPNQTYQLDGSVAERSLNILHHTPWIPTAGLYQLSISNARSLRIWFAFSIEIIEIQVSGNGPFDRISAI